MLISHTLKYLPAQLLAPAAQLLSMVLWTHWLAPPEMALYTLVAVAQEVATMLCIGWFSIYALRYLPPAGDVPARQRYLATENAVVLASMAGGALIAVLVALTLPAMPALPLGAAVIALMLVTRALNSHYAERARAQSAFVAYTLLQTVGPLGGLVLGWLALQHVQANAWVLLGAYGVAQAAATLLALPLLGMHWRLARPDAALLRAAIGFGAPVLGLGLLSWAAENYLRYLVEWRSGAAALGLMTVGWALGRRCASVASMLVATAAFPLASRLLNEGRRDEALAQLSVNAALMLAVLLPVTAALALLGPALVALTVAAEYRPLTTALLGLAVFAGVVRNLHIHVTGPLLMLDRQFKVVAAVSVVELAGGVAASLAGLALHGLQGAVLGQALGSVLALALSVYWACARLGFRWPWPQTLKVLLASAAMAAVLAWLPPAAGVAGLLAGMAAGAASYGLALALLFAPQLRRLEWAQWAHRARRG